MYNVIQRITNYLKADFYFKFQKQDSLSQVEARPLRVVSETI